MSTADEQGAAVKPRADDSTTEDRLGTVSSKTSMRTRSRPNNKSILQSAIARKERSLCVEEKPRARQKRVKQKSLDEPYIDEESSLCKKIPPLKRINKSAVNARKKPLVVAESSINVCDNNETDSKEEREFSQLSISDNKCVLESVLQQEISTKDECVVSRQCRCTENKNLYMEENGSGSQFCSAIDAINDKLIGCTKLVDVKDVPMFRPSVRVPFGLFCESHRKRLIRHNCCPTCGVFCTQGKFSECPSKHHFHKDCKLTVGQEECCPHCGDSTPSTDILISMRLAKPPIFVPIQRSLQ